MAIIPLKGSVKMSDKEKLLLFENYMRERNYAEQAIKFNLNVVKRLITSVLFVFQQSLEEIDTFSFEEFTDMIQLINEEFGGREGIPAMLDAMLSLTECLKENKLIKGGKIAYYKRMFSKKDYYLEKYDMLTGIRDDSKNYIKRLSEESVPKYFSKTVENFNMFDIRTIHIIDKFLDDIPFEENEKDEKFYIIKSFLIEMDLIEKRGGLLDTTKKGRSLSRLQIDQRYAVILYMMLYESKWKYIFEKIYRRISAEDIDTIRPTAASIFHENNAVVINRNNEVSEKNIEFLEIASDEFRLRKVLQSQNNKLLFEIAYIDMGLIIKNTLEDGSEIFEASEYGKSIFKEINRMEYSSMKLGIEAIALLYGDKKYNMAEDRIINFTIRYGTNPQTLCFLGQIMIIRKRYEEAYEVLKFAYSSSSSRSKSARVILYYLVICCKKLNLGKDTESYEKKLRNLEKV